MNRPLDQSIPFQAPKRLGQHFLRNPADFPAQLGVTQSSVGQNLNDQRRPLVGDSIEDKAGRTLRVENGSNDLFHRVFLAGLRFRSKQRVRNQLVRILHLYL